MLNEFRKTYMFQINFEKEVKLQMYKKVSTKCDMKGNYNCIFLGNLTTVSDYDWLVWMG